jgi:hypothetical protein
MWRNQTTNYYYDKVSNKRIFSKVICTFFYQIRMCIYTSRAAFVCDGQGETDEKGFHHGMWERWLKITLTTIMTHVLTSQ